MKNLNPNLLEEKESKYIRDNFLSPYEFTMDTFLNEEEKLLQNYGTGPKCLK